MTATIRCTSLLTAAAALAILAGCAAPVPRDMDGVPATARLAPGSIPPAPLSEAERQRLSAQNQQILREQATVMASEQQAAAWSRAAYAYPNTSFSLFYGGWGGGNWGGGVGISSPGYGGYGWGGYPYGWW
ncbi:MULTISPECIES: hypothetical protein [unclassified Cupriavidus]|uniref:hypothetical protein n=1 Tax=unclassified Cupriavidus TaxID=2640874 RepID=UPI0010F80A38|nr:MULTISPECIES: hypothetical protein [unclassified Cupriavidus]MWL86812.1 hypothetical protein [Cupriavidus sp. SW-Y-13]